MSFSKIEISVSAAGIGKIVIDGKDMSETLSGADIRIRANEITTVSLHYAADTAIEVDGIITTSPVAGKDHKRLA